MPLAAPADHVLSGQSSECEETIKRIRSHHGVKGVLIINLEGVPIYSSLSAEETTQHAALLSQVGASSQTLRPPHPAVLGTEIKLSNSFVDNLLGQF
jgi:hypothetical protein